MTNEEELFMQELASDPDYIAWCDQRNQEAMDEMLSMSDDKLEELFPQKYMVFVYGSLKRGFGNHGLLVGSKFLGVTDTVHHVYRMHSLGSFPAVVDTEEQHDNEAHAITGELYEVDFGTLKRLDMLEGNGCMYTRRLTSVYGTVGDIVEAWMYIMPSSSINESGPQYLVTNKFVRTDTNHNTQEWFQA